MGDGLVWRKAFDQDLWVRPVGSFLLKVHKVRLPWVKGEWTWSIEPGLVVSSMLTHASAEAAQRAAELGLRTLLRNALSLLETKGG